MLFYKSACSGLGKWVEYSSYFGVCLTRGDPWRKHHEPCASDRSAQRVSNEQMAANEAESSHGPRARILTGRPYNNMLCEKGDEMPKDVILRELRSVLNRSYSPYSNIRVSAAIKYQQDGKEIVEYGTNVENVSYGLTNCAERTAVFSAITKGMKKITEVYVMSNLDNPIMPCGACRQVLAEFIDDPGEVTVFCLNELGEELVFRFAELLPYSFKRG